MQKTNLPQERRQNILEDLRLDGKVVAVELSQRYGISKDTIRRDLREMAAAGLLKRVHGGALPVSPSAAPYSERAQRPSTAKTQLASTASALVQDGQLVVFGSGTTNLEIAKQLPPDLKITAVTASPQIALILANYRYVEVVLIGGRLNKTEFIATDAEAVAQMQRFQADICFLGVCSIHPERGITANNYEEVAMMRTLIDHSGEVVAAVTVDKLGTVAPFAVAPIDAITHIVTENHVTDGVLALYQAQGIEVLRTQ